MSRVASHEPHRKGLALLLTLAAFAAAAQELEVTVRQTPGGPRLFVNGERRVPRSVMLARGNEPIWTTKEWKSHDIVFCQTVADASIDFQFYFSNREGWCELADLTLEDDAGKVVWGKDSWSDPAVFKKCWHHAPGGTSNTVTFVDGCLHYAMTWKGVAHENRLACSPHFGTSRAPKLVAGRRYRLKFRARGDTDKGIVSPCIYEFLKGGGHKRAVVEPDPCCETAKMAMEAGCDIAFPQAPSGWKDEGVYDFRAADALIDEILSVNPKTIFFFRSGYDPPRKVMDAHPDWRTRFEDGSTMQEPAVACRPWRKAACDYLREVVRHCRTKYPQNFGGLHIGSQNAGEWLYPAHYYKPMNGFDPHTLKAWREWLAVRGEPDAATAEIPGSDIRLSRAGELLADPVKERRFIQFTRFQTEMMADAIAELAAVAREATEGKKLVMFFYAYTYEMGHGRSGHYGVMRLLEKAKGNIDAFGGPFSYCDRDWPGSSPVMAATETLARKGILWWDEDDTRTYRATTTGYGAGITKEQTLGILTRNNLSSALRGNGTWWMDFVGGGWFMDRDIWKIVSDHADLERRLVASDRPFAPEIAAIVDEASMELRKADAPRATYFLVSLGRRAFERCGAPYGQYILDDVLAGDIPAKVQFHLASWSLTPAQRAALRAQRARRPDLTRVWCWAPGYQDGRTASVSNVTDATGFAVRKVNLPDTLVRATSEGLAVGLPAEWGRGWKDQPVTPLFAVEEGQGEVWARWPDGSAAVVVRGRDVFCGVPNVPAALISAIARRAGAHVYTKPGEAVVCAREGVVMVYPHITGKLDVTLANGETRTLDAVTGITQVLEEKTPEPLFAAPPAGAPEQVEVRVRQTPGGPKLFVDGKRHLPRSVMVSSGTMPRGLTTDWRDYDLAFTPQLTDKKATIQFRFENKTYYGGFTRPDGWVRFRNLSVADETGRVVFSAATDEATLRRQWHVWDAGERGQMTFESNGVVRVDVTKPKKLSREWSTTSKFGDFHIYLSSFPVEPGRTYHARFQARADRAQDFNPSAYQAPGFIALPISPDPFDDTVRLAKEAGVDIIIPNGAGPTWRNDGTLSFERADAIFDRILAIYPEALVIARFGVRPSPRHFKDHPDWRTQFADGMTQDNESVSCLPWRDEAVRMVDAFARHLMAKYPRNFAGMHIAAHRAGEWLYEDMLCGKHSGFDVHTRAAWRRTLAAADCPDAATAEVPTLAERLAQPDPDLVPDPAKERRLILFQRMLNTEMADRILEIAAAARRATEGKKLVAFFYGYSYEVAGRGAYSGHFALDYLLRRANGNIDFLCGPFSYSDRRFPDTRPVMAPADTLARYGIMWWNEDDTRTYRETNADALLEQGRVAATKPQTLATLERNNRQNAERGHGYWWMDLRGRGWFLDRDLWRIMDKTRPCEEKRLLSDAPYAPEVATIASDENILHRRAQPLWPIQMLAQVNQRTFERCGIATGQYLLEDVLERDIPARVRFYEMSWYLTQADRAKLRAQRAARPDLVRVWMWASGYSDETGKGAEKVTDATGFRVRKVRDSRYPDASPLFAVEPEPGDEVWGRYEDGSAAIVARPLACGGWEIFHGIPKLEPDTIRRIVALRAAEPTLTVETDRIDGLYAAGETATVTITARDKTGARVRSGRVDVTVDNFGKVAVTNLMADFAVTNPFTFRVSRPDAGFLRVKAGRTLCGVGFDVSHIAPGTPHPADFAQFWREAIAKYDREIPSAPEVRVDETLSDPYWIVERVAFDAPGGRKVYGFVTRERAAKGRLPARVEIAAAGYGAWSQAPAKNRGRITLKMTVYPFEPDVKLGKKAAYDAGNADARKRWGVSLYCHGGISESREAYFFYPVILANNRAIDWFAARSDVDASKIDYRGTSQGGGLGLAAMALNGHFARGCVFVPALTDLLGCKVGNRQSGWPQLVENHPAEARAAVERNAPYFCGVNFARMITIPIRFVVGHVDVTCSPNAVYSAYNVCPSADKAICGGIGMNHGAFGDYYSYLDAWSRGREIEKPSYRFLAFNIWGPYFGNPVAERAAEIAALVRRWNPDIAGFQEMAAPFWTSTLVAELERDYAFVGRGIGVKGHDVHTPVLYRRARFDLVESGIVLQCPELDESKGAVWAVLKDKATGRKLVAFASHAWWRYDGAGDDWIRLNGAKMLTERLRELAKRHDAAVVGGGDLNAPVESDSLKWLVSQGYADAQASAEISPRGFPTEHGDPKRGPDGRYVGRNAANGHNLVKEKFRYLDHVFFDPTRVAARRFDLDISPEACRVSDHHPIVLDFDFKCERDTGNFLSLERPAGANEATAAQKVK